MSTPPKRHLPDLKYTHHLSHGGDKPGTRHGSAGDPTSPHRQNEVDQGKENFGEGKPEMDVDYVDGKCCRPTRNKNTNSIDAPMADSNPEQTNKRHAKSSVDSNIPSGNDTSGSDTEEVISDSVSDDDDTTLSDSNGALKHDQYEQGRSIECLDYGDTFIYKGDAVDSDITERRHTGHGIETRLDGDQPRRPSVAGGIDKDELFSTWKRIMKKTKPIAYSSESDDLNDEDDNSSVTVITDSDGELDKTIDHFPTVEGTADFVALIKTGQSNMKQVVDINDELFDETLMQTFSPETAIKSNDKINVVSKDGTLINKEEVFSNNDTSDSVPNLIMERSDMKGPHTMAEVMNSENTHSSLDNKCTSTDNKATKLDEIEMSPDKPEVIGAIGGEQPEDHVTGILHKRSSGHRRTASVHFSSEVLVETTHTDSEISNSSQGELSHGDGPPVVPPPPPTLVSLAGQYVEHAPIPRHGPSSALQHPPPEESNDSLLDKGGANGPVAGSTKGKHSRQSFDYKNDLGLDKKCSLPRMVSPTQLLRMKQKAVTNKIIQSRQDDTMNVFLMPHSEKTDASPETIENKSYVSEENHVHSVDRSNIKETFLEQIKRKACEIQSCEEYDVSIIEQVEHLPNPGIDEGFAQFPNITESSSGVTSMTNSTMYGNEVPGTSTDRGLNDQYHSKNNTLPDAVIQQEPHAATTNQCYEQDYYLCNPNMVDVHFIPTGARPKTTVNRITHDFNSCTADADDSKSQPFSSSLKEKSKTENACLPTKNAHGAGKSKRTDSIARSWENNSKDTHALNINSFVGTLESTSDADDGVGALKQKVWSSSDTKDTAFKMNNIQKNEDVNLIYTTMVHRESTAQPCENKTHGTVDPPTSKIVESIVEQTTDSNVDVSGNEWNNDKSLTEANNKVLKSTELTPVSLPECVYLLSQKDQAEETENVQVHGKSAKPKRRDSTARPWEKKSKGNDQHKDIFSSIEETNSDTDNDKCMQQDRSDMNDIILPKNNTHLNENTKCSMKTRRRDSTARPWENKQQATSHPPGRKYVDSIVEQRSDSDGDLIEYPVVNECCAKYVSLTSLLQLLDKISCGDIKGINDISTLVEKSPDINMKATFGKANKSGGQEYWEDKNHDEKLLHITSLQSLLDFIKSRNNRRLNYLLNLYENDERAGIVEGDVSVSVMEAQCALMSALMELMEKIKDGDVIIYDDISTKPEGAILASGHESTPHHDAATTSDLPEFTCKTEEPDKLADSMIAIEKIESSEQPGFWFFRTSSGEMVLSHSDSSPSFVGGSTSSEQPGYWFFKMSQENIANQVDKRLIINSSESSEEPGYWCFRRPSGDLVIGPSDSLPLVDGSKSTDHPGYWFFKQSLENISMQQSQNDIAEESKTNKPQHTKKEPSTILYPTSSKLLRKIDNRIETAMAQGSPGLGAFDYTTPSRLFEKVNDIEVETNTDKNDGFVDNTSPEKQSDTIIFPTSSKLLRKIENRDETEKARTSPGLGTFDYTTPSRLFEKMTNIEATLNVDHNKGVANNSTSPEKQSDTIIYPTSSKLLRKIENRDETEMGRTSPGLGAFDYSTPSRLFEKITERECVASTNQNVEPVNSTPPPETYNHTQEMNLIDAVREMDTERTSSVDQLPCTTMHDVGNKMYINENTPCLEYFTYTSPSTLFQNIQELIDLENVRTKAIKWRDLFRRNRNKYEPEHNGEEEHDEYAQICNGKDIDTVARDEIPRAEEPQDHNEKTTSNVSSPTSEIFSHASPSELFESVQDVIDSEKVRDVAINWREQSKKKKKDGSHLVNDIEFDSSDISDQIGNADIQQDTRAREEIPNMYVKSEQVVYTESYGQFEEQTTGEWHVENVRVHANKWKARCKRKERLDRLQRNVLRENVQDGNGQMFEVRSASDSDIREEDTGTNIGVQNSEIEQNPQTIPDITAPFEFLNGLLTRFLNMMQETEMLGLPFREDDFKELQLIYSSIAQVAAILDEDLGEHEISKSNKHGENCDLEHTDKATNTSGPSPVSDNYSNIRATQLQRYLDLLISVLHRTMMYLTSHSEPDLSKHMSNPLAGMDVNSDNEHNYAEEGKHKNIDYDSCVTLENILFDLDSVRQSTCSLLSDYGTFTGQTFIPHKISKDSLASGYIADQCSSEDSLPERDRRVSYHGYEGDVSSSERTLPSQTVVHGWTFSNDFLNRTSPSNVPVETPTMAPSRWYYRDENQTRSPSTQTHPRHCDSSVHFISNPNYKSSDSEQYYVENDESHEACFSPDSIAASDPTLKLRRSGCVHFPEDSESVNLDFGSSGFRRNESNRKFLEEGSPERGQRSFGSSQHTDRRGDPGSKRKQPVAGGRGVAPDARSHMMEKEVMESQNRKLQTEVSRLQTENKLLKEKHNRAQSRISDVESQLQDAQDDLNSLQENLNKEMSAMSSRNQSEFDHDRQQLQAKVMTLTQENETLKAEMSSLEKQLDSSHHVTDMARHNSEKTRTLEAHKAEISTLKEELGRVKALLEQSERHLREEEDRHAAASTQVLRLTELKNALQQQSDIGSNGTASDKQLSSLEARLKVTEERLHHERADRANNLSTVEDKLLTENSRLQAVEKDMTRQLHRERDKNRNLEHRMKQTRDENEKLRLAIPFDDSTLLSDKDKYDIPYSSHSNQRAESMKVSDDMNYIYSQIERQDGVQSNQHEELICTVWNKRELAYRQLRAWEVQLEELQIADNNNLVDGLKNLRDTYGQAESKLRTMEEKLEDAQAQMTTIDTTYKLQLSGLVHERHEAFARLKTAEDILAAMQVENEMLHRSIGHSAGSGADRAALAGAGQGQMEALRVQCSSLEGKVSQLTRSNSLLEGEVTTAKVQLDARTKELQDCRSELELAYSRLQGDTEDERKQAKIDKLTAQVNHLQREVKQWTDKCNAAVSEKLKVDSELSTLRKSPTPQKPRQQKTEQVDSRLVEQLREELAEKDGHVTSVSKQLDDTENQLQKLQQELYIEQEHTAELEYEVDTLQQTVTQRANMFEALSGTEREQLAQYQVLKDSLDSVSQELAQKHAQIISLDVNLSGQKDRTAELEKGLQELRESQSGDAERPKKDVVTAADKLRIQELEIERASLKQELMQTYNAIQASEEQFRALQTENKQLEQEIVKDKTVILQVTAEKGEVEQHLEELAEEHDSLIQEKIQAEDDLLKLEQKLQEILQKYEAEARKHHGKFDRQYTDLPAESHQLVSELDSVRLLLDGKEKEMEMLDDRISRQIVEIEFLNRKVDLVHNDSIQNREDVARMISELTLKMKEAVATREVNQFLSGERTKLQTQHQHLETELETERRNNDQRKLEINDVIRKIEKGEHHQKSAEKDNVEMSHTIVSLEADLRNTSQNLAAQQTENAQLRNKVDHFGEDVVNLTAINATLEKHLEMEKQALLEEKTTSHQWKDETNHTSHDLESLRHEHSLLSNKLVVEQQAVESLKREIEVREEKTEALRGNMEALKRESDTNKGQLLITKDTVHKLTQDKGTIHQDYEAMCRSLTEKERQLSELRERMDERLEGVKREHVQERIRLERESTSATQERDLSKQEADALNEQLRQKEIQLNTFGKTLQELQEVTRAKKQLEGHVQRLEACQGDSKLLLQGHRTELTSISDAHAKQQESHTRLQAQNQLYQADLKSLKESSSREERELKITINELKSQHENERHYLNDNLAQTQTTLRSLEASFATATEQRDTALAQKRVQESTIEDLQSRLADENTGRRLTEQSVGTLRLHLEDSKNDKNVAEARFAEANHQLSKLEGQLRAEQERNKKLTGRLQQLGTVAQSTEGSVKAKTEQVETLQKEISKLRQLLESQKQSLSGKMKKANLEYKQQMDLILEDKEKLAAQVQQLSSSLDTCKEQIASKNKANLKLQEELLCLEGSVNESKVKAKHAEETLRAEAENQSHLSSSVAAERDDLVEWYRAQEEELKRLRNFLAKKAESSGEADKAMWQEMNRVIQELSRQMQDHLDTQSPGNKDDRDGQRVVRLKKQMSELHGELSTEKSLHQITKTSLQALEEDCQRLRNQLYKHRRREGPASDKKYKNRMEAINAIIARSQTQAQALLASGGFMDDSLLSPRGQRSPRVGYHSPRRPESPDDSYAEDLSIASLPPMHYASGKTTSSRYT